MSNILDVFRGGSSGNGVPDEDCLGCLATSSGVMTFGGLYLATGAVFRPLPGEKLSPAATPAWQRTVRGAGGLVFLFGLYRGYQLYEAWNKQKVKGKSSSL